MTFEVRPIRFHQEGITSRAGATWTEINTIPTNRIKAVGKILWIFGIFAFPFHQGYSFLMIASGLAIHAAGHVFKWRRRSLIFERDGTSSADEGLPYGGGKRLIWHHDNIVSIEASRRTYQRPSAVPWEQSATNVALIGKDGETVYVARDLSIEAARHVAVQVTQALDELRNAEGDSDVRGWIEPDDLIE